MATSVIPVSGALTPDGYAFTDPPTAAAADQVFANNGRVLFLVKNGDSTSTNVTFDVPAVSSDGSTAGLAIADRVVAVAAGKTAIIGPFPMAIYNNQSTQQVAVSYSKTTSLNVGVLTF